MKSILNLSIAVGLLGASAAYYLGSSKAPGVQPPTVASQPKDVAIQMASTPSQDSGLKTPQPIVATGIVTPEEMVEISAQVDGMIESFGPDPSDPAKTIDQGSVVRKGDVLARIDSTIYKARVDFAEASLLRAKANLLQLQAKHNQMKHEWLRAQTLLPDKAIAGTEYDLAVANYEAAVANVAVGKAIIQECEASLRMAEITMDRTVIRSPIDGVVIDRRVNVGRSLVTTNRAATSLFLIAKDLRKMQVWASVREADIGRIQPGMPARFTLDAYPNEVFQGKVASIRLNPAKEQQGLTYVVVVSSTSERGILPYLTAKLRFDVGHPCSAQAVFDETHLKRGGLQQPQKEPLAAR